MKTKRYKSTGKLDFTLYFCPAEVTGISLRTCGLHVSLFSKSIGNLSIGANNLIC